MTSGGGSGRWLPGRELDRPGPDQQDQEHFPNRPVKEILGYPLLDLLAIVLQHFDIIEISMSTT